MGIEGEELAGCIGAVGFLKSIEAGEEPTVV